MFSATVSSSSRPRDCGRIATSLQEQLVRRRRAAEEADGPGVGLLEAGDQGQQRRLARSGPPGHRHDLPPLDERSTPDSTGRAPPASANALATPRSSSTVSSVAFIRVPPVRPAGGRRGQRPRSRRDRATRPRASRRGSTRLRMAAIRAAPPRRRARRSARRRGAASVDRWPPPRTRPAAARRRTARRDGCRSGRPAPRPRAASAPRDRSTPRSLADSSTCSTARRYSTRLSAGSCSTKPMVRRRRRRRGPAAEP